ncbi:Dynein light chain 1, cytoplasmic [Halotydeus destructor]|nr:Dynein light chain 1, cytoplasmic [Halotydeus destructor]
MNYSTDTRSVKSMRIQNHSNQLNGPKYTGSISELDSLFQTHGIKNRMFVWRSVSMGVSFIALILISSKLYSLSKEVNFLQLIIHDWLPRYNNTLTAINQNGGKSSEAFHIENLRQDIELLIIELWSSRTTLILGMVFVFAYLLSWGWMSYVMQETNMAANVNLKTVLLLVVFAAVDIAASAGFIMVRVIMSSSGTTDIFVSGLVALLTTIRVYIVASAVNYYNQARREPYSFSLANVNKLDEEREKSSMPGDNFVKPMPSNYLTSWTKAQSSLDLWQKGDPVAAMTSHKDLGVATGRKYSRSVASSRASSIGDEAHEEEEEEVNADEFKIQAADMPLHMQRAALHSAIQACRVFSTEKQIAESLKQDFDQMFTPTWHCIVGRNWGSCVTHSKQCYIRILYRHFTILLYKSTS